MTDWDLNYFLGNGGLKLLQIERFEVGYILKIIIPILFPCQFGHVLGQWHNAIYEMRMRGRSIPF